MFLPSWLGTNTVHTFVPGLQQPGTGYRYVSAIALGFENARVITIRDILLQPMNT